MNPQEESTPTSSAPDLVDKVVENLLGDSLHDDELQEMVQFVATFGKLLSRGPTDALNGYANGIADTHAEYLAIDKKKKLINELSALSDHFQDRTHRIKKQHETCMSQLNSHGGPKYVNQLNEQYKNTREKLTTMQRTLKANGYSEQISVESMDNMERQLRSLEEQFARVNKELEPFDGLEANESAVKKKIQEKRVEIEKLESSLLGGSTSFLS